MGILQSLVALLALFIILGGYAWFQMRYWYVTEYKEDAGPTISERNKPITSRKL